MKVINFIQKIFIFLLCLNYIKASQYNEEKDSSNETNIKSDIYKHGSLLDVGSIIKAIEGDKKSTLTLCNRLVEMHRKGVAKKGKKVYFVLGPCGSGKSTFIYACQGNKVFLKKKSISKQDSDDDSWADASSNGGINEDNSEELSFTKLVKGDVPKVQASANGVTAGSKIYYRGEKNSKIAFCDTEGFLGLREVESDIDKVMYSFYPFFCLKANDIGGIIFLVSGADIEAARGNSFRLSANFVKNYFLLGEKNQNIEKIKSSFFLVINKSRSEKKKIASDLRKIIQKSYKDFYSYKKKNTNSSQDNFAHLKPFFSLFLKKHIIGKEHVDDENNFSFRTENMHFFFPYKEKSVDKAIRKIKNLSVLDKKYITSGQDAIYQFINRVLLERSNEINKEVNSLLHSQQVLNAIKAKNKGVDFSKTISNLEDYILLLKKNKKKTFRNDFLETVYKDEYIRSIPYYREKGFWKNNHENMYQELIQKPFVEGNVFSDNPGVVGKVGSALAGVIALIGTPISYPLCSLIEAGGYVYKGYLRKRFEYKGGEPIYEILINFKNGTFKFEGKSSFRDLGFDTKTYKGGKTMMTSIRKKQGVKKDKWSFFYVTDYEKDAFFTIEMKSIQKYSKASDFSIKDDESRIKYTSKTITYIKEKLLKADKSDLKKILHDQKIFISNEIEKLKVNSLKEMLMIVFWYKKIVDQKTSGLTLMEKFQCNFEDIIGGKKTDDKASISSSKFKSDEGDKKEKG